MAKDIQARFSIWVPCENSEMKFTGGITAFVGTVARSGNGGRFAMQPFSTFSSY